MHHVRVVEAAHDVNDGIHFADVRKELIAQAFTFGRAGDQARDVDEFDGRGRPFRRARQFGQAMQALVGNRHDPNISFDRAKWVVLGLGPRIAQRVKQGGFAHIRKTDYAATQRHAQYLEGS